MRTQRKRGGVNLLRVGMEPEPSSRPWVEGHKVPHCEPHGSPPIRGQKVGANRGRNQMVLISYMLPQIRGQDDP